jgi:hypothetical protein
MGQMSRMYGIYIGMKKYFSIDPVEFCVLLQRSLSRLRASAKYGVGEDGAHRTTTSYNTMFPYLQVHL